MTWNASEPLSFVRLCSWDGQWWMSSTNRLRLRTLLWSIGSDLSRCCCCPFSCCLCSGWSMLVTVRFRLQVTTMSTMALMGSSPSTCTESWTLRFWTLLKAGLHCPLFAREQNFHSKFAFVSWVQLWYQTTYAPALSQVIGDKGQHVEGPVSCWRSVFVANEFSELGTIRRSHPPLSFFILVRLLLPLVCSVPVPYDAPQ